MQKLQRPYSTAVRSCMVVYMSARKGKFTIEIYEFTHCLRAFLARAAH